MDVDLIFNYILVKSAIKSGQVSKSIVSVLFECSVNLGEIPILNFHTLPANHGQFVKTFSIQNSYPSFLL